MYTEVGVSPSLKRTSPRFSFLMPPFSMNSLSARSRQDLRSLTLLSVDLEWRVKMLICLAMLVFIIAISTGLLIGGAFTLLALAWRRRHDRKWAEHEAHELVDGAKKDA